ncbi:hypothetical protein [Kitasatospora cathayae]|uniref:PknH-like extracellular domain-containing protein n=1 Tax=Kitasatospora cathayae TaxID=3004092 RepID=A0ABY7Q0V8_9ACTN|nr:hypothetical protein [Kitasatospora sp. HUAS 3-15]WBP86094.1 hypothetical protein O1G21_09745 [Kitasatospora sp. HUAS 3-15]
MSLPRPLHALTAAVLVVAAALGPAAAAGAAGAVGDAPTPTLPSADQLKPALLTVDDVGPGYTEVPSTESPSPSPSANPTPVSGCDALSALINTHATAPGPGTPHAETELDGQDGNPMVIESLTAEDPAKLTTDFNTATDAFKTCHTITFNAGTEDSVTFTVTPVTLGDRPDAPAVRLDGTVAGVQLNAYLGVERFGTVAMAYGFFQRQASDSQTASMQYRTAVAKVEHTLGTTAGSTTPPTAVATQGMSV